jgi:magnesium-transporting ATPase (P-type)
MQYCPTGLPNLNNEQDIQNFCGCIEYEPPSDDLRNFDGILIVPTDKLPPPPVPEEIEDDEDGPRKIDPPPYTCFTITMDNLALRGVTIKNTAAIYGVVIYTGKETRLAKNTKSKTHAKFATVERLKLYFIYLFI